MCMSAALTRLVMVLESTKKGRTSLARKNIFLDCENLHVLEWWFAGESSVHWFAPKVVSKFYVLKYVTGARTTTGE